MPGWPNPSLKLALFPATLLALSCCASFGAAAEPPGSRIAYSRAPSDVSRVVVADPDNSHRVVIGHNKDRPSISPNGRRLVCRDLNSGRIQVSSIGGRDRHFLLKRNGLDQTDPSWGPHGRIAFGGSGNRTGHRLFIVSADGTGLRHVALRPGLVGGSPAFRPDGKRIAFIGTDGRRSDVYTVSSSGRKVRRLTHFRRYEHPSSPNYSPDGHHLIFGYNNFASDVARVKLIRADGSHEQNVTPKRLRASEGAFAPAGERVLISGGQLADLYTIDLDGNRLERVTKEFGLEFDPAWSTP